jgi:hypothetical protein
MQLVYVFIIIILDVNVTIEKWHEWNKRVFLIESTDFVIIYIQDVEWIFVHKHFTCNSENPLILVSLIIFSQNLKHKSCRVKKKNVPKILY